MPTKPKAKDPISEALESETKADPDSPTTDTFAGLDITVPAAIGQGTNILIYGESGVGKTVLSGSASIVKDMDPVLFIDVEGGTLSLKEFYPDCKVIRVKSWVELQRVADEFLKGKAPFKTVVIDSLTEIQKLSMSDIMKKAVREDPTKDPDMPGIREWGKNAEQTRRFIRAFRDLPVNTIFTALASVDKDDKGRQVTRPMMNGKIAGELPGLVDIVLFTYVKQQGDDHKRLLLTTNTNNVMAKDRSNKLPAVMQNPTMQDIYGRIIGTVQGEESEQDQTEAQE